MHQPGHTSRCCPWPAGGARRCTADSAHPGERTKPQLPHRCLPWHQLPPQCDPKEPAAGDFGVPFRYSFIILCTFRHVALADLQGLTGMFFFFYSHCFLLCHGVILSFRLLSQLNEKEREYQELLRSSVCRKQEQIDALRTAAAAPKGKIFVWNTGCVFFLSFMVVLEMKAPLLRYSFVWSTNVWGLETQDVLCTIEKTNSSRIKGTLKSTAV